MKSEQELLESIDTRLFEMDKTLDKTNTLLERIASELESVARTVNKMA